jgi:hypothetical protein
MAQVANGQEQKNRFKQIFHDGWADFKAGYPRYEAVDEVVQKMLGCGERENGYAVYLCPECLRWKQVPFSCKSSFCLSCAQTYTTNWVETVQGMLPEGVKYRHVVLTVPAGLRGWFYRNEAELYEGLMNIAAPMMDDAVQTAVGRKVEMGYIVVLQTAGRAANYNPHLHIIMTAGGLDEQGHWHEVSYLPYAILHKKWQYYLLTMVKAVLANEPEAVGLIDELWRQYPKGFVAHLKAKAVPKLAELARYVAKYVVSPPIALSRITAYDAQQGLVTYWYEDHQQGRQEVSLSRDQFIGRMVQHILPKGFKRIRYYGLQATCKLKKVGAILKQALKQTGQAMLKFVAQGPISAVVKLRYRVRIKRAYGHDPLRCRHCGGELWLWQVWHPKYGLIYDESDQLRQGVYESPLDVEPSTPRPATLSMVQLSLFDLSTPFVYA